MSVELIRCGYRNCNSVCFTDTQKKRHLCSSHLSKNMNLVKKQDELNQQREDMRRLRQQLEVEDAQRRFQERYGPFAAYLLAARTRVSAQN